MGIKKSKPLSEGTVLVNSTVISSDSVMVIDGRILLPVHDEKDASVIEIDLKQKKIEVLRGIKGKLTNRFLTESKTNAPDAFVFNEDSSIRKQSFTL